MVIDVGKICLTLSIIETLTQMMSTVPVTGTVLSLASIRLKHNQESAWMEIPEIPLICQVRIKFCRSLDFPYVLAEKESTNMVKLWDISTTKVNMQNLAVFKNRKMLGLSCELIMRDIWPFETLVKGKIFKLEN